MRHKNICLLVRACLFSRKVIILSYFLDHGVESVIMDVTLCRKIDNPLYSNSDGEQKWEQKLHLVKCFISIAKWKLSCLPASADQTDSYNVVE